MTLIIIISLSFLIQLAAAFFSLRIIHISPHKKIWIIISIALFLMAARRFIPLYHSFFSGAFSADPLYEIFGLVLSLLILIGTIMLRPILFDQIKADEKFRQTHQRLNEIIEFLPDATFVIDNERKIIAWNRAVEVMTGVKKEEMMGRSDYSLCFYNEQRPILIDIALNPDKAIKVHYPKLVIKENEFQGEIFVPKVWAGKGAYCWFVASKLMDADGNVIGAIESVRDVTERQLAQQRLNNIIEHLPDATFVIDNERKIIAWNRAVEVMTGVKKEEMMGRSDYSLCFYNEQRPILIDIALDPDEAVKVHYPKLVIKENEFQGEIFVPKVWAGKGAYCWFVASKLMDADGNVIGAIESVRDVTERQLAQQRLNDIIEHLPDATFVIDKERKIIAWNRAVEIMTGVKKEEMMGRSDYSLCFYNEQRPILIDIVLDPDKAVNVKYSSIIIKDNEVDGQTFVPKAWGDKGAYCWAYASKLLDADGNVIGAIESVRDVTERQLAQQRLNDIIEFLPDPTFVIDKDKKVLFWNQAMEIMTGIEKKMVIGKSDYASYIYDDDRPILIDIVLDPSLAIKSKYSVLEIVGHKAYGEIFAPKLWNGKGAYCWVATSKLFDTAGNVIGAIESIRDITDKEEAKNVMMELNQKLEDRVNRIVTELRDKDQLMILQSRQAAMGEMLGNIAHQWRQPLNVIGICVQNILECQKAGKLDRDYLENNIPRIMAQILQMSRTIDDFRNFFKPDKEKAMFDLKRSITDSFSFVAMSYKDHGVETVMNFAEDITANGYPNEFSQVLLNLFNNALDAIKDIKPSKPRVTVRVFPDKGRSVITITDNAGGIDPKIIHKIFDPYFTTKEMGTGIGLYMAKTIIEKNMNGKLLARNVDGGAEFRIEL